VNHHENARLTFAGRRILVSRIIHEGLPPVREAAKAQGVSPRTAYKWLRRFREEGEAGFYDQSSEEREVYLPQWLHYNNWHRPHGSLGNQAPISRLEVGVNGGGEDAHLEHLESGEAPREEAASRANTSTTSSGNASGAQVAGTAMSFIAGC